MSSLLTFERGCEAFFASQTAFHHRRKREIDVKAYVCTPKIKRNSRILSRLPCGRTACAGYERECHLQKIEVVFVFSLLFTASFVFKC